MKKLILITLLIIPLFASKWCPITGLKINENLKTSYSAKLEANDDLRIYSSIYALHVEFENYGLYDIKAYNIKTKKYEKLSPNELKNRLEKAKKALHVEFKKRREIYKKRAYPMGKKLYNKRCNTPIDLEEFLEISELKEYVSKNCKLENEMYLHATTVYLWDVKREGGVINKESRIKVDKTEKCPVCGMFVYKYPKWAAKIEYEKKSYFFDGVKDLMKYYFEHKEEINQILVSDYYSLKAIDAKKAFFVIGSDIYGPMGHELIPFEELHNAENFKKDHKGVKIVKFEDIKANLAYDLDVAKFY